MSKIDLMNVIVCDGLALAFLALGVWKGLTRRYLYLNLYCVSLLACSAARQVVLHSYGLRSTKYFYTYFQSDLVLAVVRYLAILSVFEIILRDSALRDRARRAFLACFAIVAIMSYFAISNSISHIYGRYIIELQQNMYFASVVLTFLMCIALAHLRVADPQLRVLVFGLGVFGGIQAGGYALQNMLPKSIFDASWDVIRRVLPFATHIMLALWCAALIRVPAIGRVLARPEEFSEGITDHQGEMLEPVFARVGGTR
jgi:sorbitol-specific phosphotransferase system component IIC